MIWIDIWIHDHEEYREINVGIHMLNSSMSSCHWFGHWIHNYEIIYEFLIISCENSVLWRRSWNYGWIPGNELTYEIMAEFINLKLSASSFKFISIREIVLLIQSNNRPFFAVSSLQTPRLLRGCCSVATRPGDAAATADVGCCAQQSREHAEGLWSTWLDVTGVEVCWACLSAIKDTLETFKLRDYQRNHPQGHNSDGAIRSSEGFQAGEGKW